MTALIEWKTKGLPALLSSAKRVAEAYASLPSTSKMLSFIADECAWTKDPEDELKADEYPEEFLQAVQESREKRIREELASVIEHDKECNHDNLESAKKCHGCREGHLRALIPYFSDLCSYHEHEPGDARNDCRRKMATWKPKAQVAKSNAGAGRRTASGRDRMTT